MMNVQASDKFRSRFPKPKIDSRLSVSKTTIPAPEHVTITLFRDTEKANETFDIELTLEQAATIGRLLCGLSGQKEMQS